jgi:acyl dehydratase
MTAAPVASFDVESFDPYIGQVLPASPEFCYEPIERSEIRRFAYSVGDYNPLYLDEAYARESRYGGLIAPPYFFYAIHRTTSAAIPEPEARQNDLRPPGQTLVYAGTDWIFRGVVRPGDTVRCIETFVGAKEKASSYAGRIILTTGKVEYVNQRDEVVAVALSTVARFQLASATARRKYLSQDAGEDPYPEEFLDRVDRDRAAMVIRGREPLYFDDVPIGAEMTPIIQGPLYVPEIAIFQSGYRTAPAFGPCFTPYPPDVAQMPIGKMLERDPWTHGQANNRAGDTARARAIPGSFDVGMQRVSWFLRAAASWAGDDADVVGASIRVIRPNMVGNVSWYRGVVRDKAIVDGGGETVLAVTAQDQHGDQHADGTVRVRLPLRAGSGPRRDGAEVPGDC